MRNKPFILFMLLCFVLSTGVAAIGHCKHTLQEAIAAEQAGACEDADCDFIEATVSSTVTAKHHKQAVKHIRIVVGSNIQHSNYCPPFRNRNSVKPGQENSIPLYLLNRSIII